MKLEDLQATAAVRGILTDGVVTVVSVRWFGSDALELTYRGAGGELGSEILYRDDDTRNEILYSLNKPDDYRLAIVEFLDRDAHRVHYHRQPFHREPDFGANSVNYSFKDLLARAQPPH